MEEQYHDKIQLYLNGALSSIERTAFENEIRENAELADLVSILKLEQEAVYIALKQDVKNKFERWDKEKAIQKKRSIRLLISLLILLILGGLYWYFIPEEPPKCTTNKCFAQEMEKLVDENNIFRSNSSTTIQDSSLLQLKGKLDKLKLKEDFETSISVCNNYIEKYSDKTQTNQEIEWLMIKYYFLQEKQEEAIRRLKLIETDIDHKYHGATVNLLKYIRK